MYHGDTLGTMAQNTRLRDARMQAGLSQAALAQRVQEVGAHLGIVNECNRANVARWEGGGRPQPHYVLILEATLHRDAAALGFAYQTHGMNRERMLSDAGLSEEDITLAGDTATLGPLTGIWLSEYVYHSDSRNADFTSRHYCQLLQRGAHLNIRSLPKQASAIALDLALNGQMSTGTWTEHTEQGGYYSGAVYSGAIQLEVNATGTRLTGKWVGFGRDPGEINTGAWRFSRVADYSPDAAPEWDREPALSE
jgi:transcriptional regulator with XRE-family HTH domain